MLKSVLKEPIDLPKPSTDFFRSARALLGVGEHRPHLAGEGPDLVADRLRRLGEEALAGLEGRVERFRLRDQPDQRRAGGEREGAGAAEPGLDRGQRRRELDQRLLDRLLLVGEVAERRLRAADEAFDVGAAAAELGGQLAEVVDHVGERDPALGDRLVQFGDVADEGLEAAEGAAELLAAVADPFGPAGEQELDVLAGVRVERGEEGVEVGVRFGLGERDVVAGLEMPRSGPGADLDGHVVEVRFRPQQQGRVGVDQLHVLRFDVHADLGVAFLERDRGDLADLDAGDHDRLALAGGDRLGGFELTGDVDELFADEGRP